jgi:hypothetical protein
MKYYIMKEKVKMNSEKGSLLVKINVSFLNSQKYLEKLKMDKKNVQISFLKNNVGK